MELFLAILLAVVSIFDTIISLGKCVGEFHRKPFILPGDEITKGVD